MSLIEEALRRLQEPLLKPTQPPPAASAASEAVRSTPPQTAPPAASAPSAHSWSTAPSSSSPFVAPARPSTPVLVLVTTAVFTLTVGLLLWGGIWMGHTLSQRQEASLTSSVDAPTGQLTQLTGAPKPATAPQPRKADELVLTGVVEGGGAPFAVINETVVGIGDQVQGTTVLAIASGAVTLRGADGRDQVLQLAR